MTQSPRPGSTRWAELAGESSGAQYAERFAKLAAAGHDLHGEARYCAGLAAPPARVLDAGCGTGRVAIRLAELGYRCTGVDLDPSMLAQAQAAGPELDWRLADLATLVGPGEFELIVAAGNVIPLLAEGSLTATLASFAAQLGESGELVTGFGLDAAHLPAGCPVTPLAAYDAAAEAAGLRLRQRHAGWDGQPGPITGYAVSVHSRVG